jgi:diacylglycerol kinase (ATP)
VSERSPAGLGRLWRATVNSWNGLCSGAKSEQAIREELFALVLALPLAFLIGTTMARRLEMIAVVMLVLTVELLNTAIEKLADRVTMEHDSQIGRVKDLGSAAVGIALLIAGMVWVFALGERMGMF